MKLREIIKGVKARVTAKDGRIDIHNITDDSRKVSRLDLFIALKGHALDASRFIGDAISCGAKAIVSEKDFICQSDIVKILVGDARAALSKIADNYYHHPSDKLNVIGITGTNGKTTITYLLESIVNSLGEYAGVIGTINYRLKGKVVPAVNTTPGQVVLQKMLAEMVSVKARYAIMEVSSHALDQGRVDKVRFDVGIFTNLTSDHLDYHKTAASYFKAKARLFDHMKTRGMAILNADDKKVISLKTRLKCKTLTYGIKADADIMAKDIALAMDGTSFTVITPRTSFKARTKLIGLHNVSNILAAVAAAIAMKIPEKAIVRGIGAMKRVPGRLDPVDAGQHFKVLVDFAHTEDALFNVLSLLREVARKRIVTVFGCGGNRDRTKRPLMGRVACEYSDHVIVTSDNPRSEKPEEIIGEIELGIKGRFTNYDIVIDRRAAIAKAMASATKGDIVIIAGKGHENYQIVGDRILPFDDRKIAREILKKGNNP